MNQLRNIELYAISTNARTDLQKTLTLIMLLSLLKVNWTMFLISKKNSKVIKLNRRTDLHSVQKQKLKKYYVCHEEIAWGEQNIHLKRLVTDNNIDN